MVLFDLKDVDERTKIALVKNFNNPEESRQIYMEEIMDWTDYYTENLMSSADLDEKEKALNAISNLWLHCAQFEINLHQYKRAVDLFEQATNDPVASKSGTVYQTYANYCVDRKKLSNAQKVYLKGLCAGLIANENKQLWDNFLLLMHNINSSTDLSLQQLYDAVKKQLGDNAHSLADIQSVPSATIKREPNVSDTAGEYVFNEAKVDEDHLLQSAERVEAADSLVDALEEESGGTGEPAGFAASDDLDRVVGLTPELVVRTFDRRPPMIFSAANKEPMVSGTSQLSPAEVQELEEFLGGTPLARLATSRNHHENRPVDGLCSADKVLDLLETMWCCQALKERHFDSWISDLSALHTKEEKELLSALNKRQLLAPAEKGTQSNYQVELRQFDTRCAVQKELLHGIINKTMFALLLEQQECLSRIRFPRFSLSILERIRKYVSAPRPAKAPVSSSSSKADFDAIVEHVKKQQRLVCALLSVRLSFVHSERSRAQSSARLQHKLMLSRESSDGAVDGADTRDALLESGGGDYYSLEAKKGRKRRRLVDQHSGESYSQSSVNSYAGSANSPRQSFAGQRGVRLDEEVELQSGPPAINQAALPLLQKLASMLQEVQQG